MLKKNQEAILKSPDVLECVPASLSPIKIDVREVYFIHQALYSKKEEEQKQSQKSNSQTALVIKPGKKNRLVMKHQNLNIWIKKKQ